MSQDSRGQGFKGPREMLRNYKELMTIPARKERLYSRREIQKRVKELAGIISKDYRKEDLILIGVLKGAFVFLSDLARNLSIPVKLDFVRLASYGSQSQTQGEVRLTKTIEIPIQDKHILVVEDIVDSGLTLNFLLEFLKKENPKSVRICALINKSERREVPINIDYVGFSVPEGFIVGYGLDFDERYRHLPELYHLSFN
jgi:hypoxanthine phosphoribosyltransferase